MTIVLTLNWQTKNEHFDNNRHRPTPLWKADASGKKTKKIATARKNSNATAHCTHLSLPAHTQANPKAKSKECNRQRFIPYYVGNYLKNYETYSVTFANFVL